MSNIIGWLVTGLFICAFGGVAMVQDAEIAKVIGWIVLAVGGVVTQVGVVAVGVFVALQERDRARK